MLKLADPLAHLHVFSPDAPEPWKHRIFRDHLRRDSADRDLYAQTKREAAELATNGEETMMEYNARKQAVIRDIYARAFPGGWSGGVTMVYPGIPFDIRSESRSTQPNGKG